MMWQTTRFQVDLSRPRVMGIVNVTPDSFSDGGAFAGPRSALFHCEKLLADGADILDIGGESSRPGAQSITVEVEWQRLHPVLKEAVALGCPVSLDTTKPEIMQRALQLGVDILNDIHALQAPGALQAAAAVPTCGVCLMHMQGAPRSMQAQPNYGDVVQEVARFLGGRAAALRAAGIEASRIVLDPGIGFGKTPEHNFALLQRQSALVDLGYPLLVGWSRKSSLGWLTGRGVEGRMAGSVAAALACVQRGARVVRVHDVAETVDALKVWHAAGLSTP
jgi:dihydropteroate synthase